MSYSWYLSKRIKTLFTHRYHPRVLGWWEHILSKIPGRGHRERIQQGKMLLQMSIFASRMRKLVHVSGAQSTGTLPVNEWVYNDYIQCIDWMMEYMKKQTLCILLHGIIAIVMLCLVIKTISATTLHKQYLDEHFSRCTCVTVPYRIRTLFCHVFRAHHQVWCAVALSFC